MSCTGFEDKEEAPSDPEIYSIENNSEDRYLGDVVATGPYLDSSAFGGTPIDQDEWMDMIQNADKVIAYNWNGNEGNPANTEHYMILNDRIDNSAVSVKELNPSEKKQWAALVTQTENYEEITPMCFIPHIAFLYYQGDTIVGQSNICFLCAAIFNQPGREKCLTTAGTKEVKSFCRSLGLQIYDDHDSVSG